jgi:hypothetical protein
MVSAAFPPIFNHNDDAAACVMDMANILADELSSRDDGLAHPSRSKFQRQVQAPTTLAASKRDPRIDVIRGMALLMIFVDHIPGNALGLATLRNFGFSDAAEVFVFLAGMSAMLAYGKGFQRDGTLGGLHRVFRRWGRLYLFHVGLFLTTCLIVLLWTTHYHLQPRFVAPIINAPISGLIRGLLLQALPSYLDILPLYLVLLAAFPLIYFGLRRNLWLALAASATLWLAANLNADLNLPNWINHGRWFFNPFAWQFLFTIGAAFALPTATDKRSVRRISWVAWLCIAYLGFAFLEAAPWADWNLPDLRPIILAAPDKTLLAPLRLLDVLSLAYLLLSSDGLRMLAGRRIFRPLEICGRHSLEVFAVGCIAALLGRLLFRTYGAGIEAQIAINVIGIAMMCVVGLWLEKRRTSRSPGFAWFGGRDNSVWPVFS